MTTDVHSVTRWRGLLDERPARPVLVHLNGDTTWLLQIPYPDDGKKFEEEEGSKSEEEKKPEEEEESKSEEEEGKPSGEEEGKPSDEEGKPSGEETGLGGDNKRKRRFFNLLIDPWLTGPQSDVAGWFSTQTHVVPPAVEGMGALEGVLREVYQEDDEQPDRQQEEQNQRRQNEPLNGREAAARYIHAVVISHEFTDHCHEATLTQLPRDTPIYASDVAADLIRSWGYFDRSVVVNAPGLTRGMHWREVSGGLLPAWLRVGRVVVGGDALYYHSAMVIAFPPTGPYTTANGVEDGGDGRGSCGGNGSEGMGGSDGECVVYTPHGIAPANLTDLFPSCGLSTLAMLHGLHDVRLWATKQLNLGGLSGVKSVRAAGARYWVATHDEVKKGRGLIAPLLRRRIWTVEGAEEGSRGEQRGKEVRNGNGRNGNGDEKRRGGVKEEEGVNGEEGTGYVFWELASGGVLRLE